MKIAIIEKGHFEVAYTLIQLFDNDRNKLTIFIDEPSYDQLTYLLKEKSERYKWVIQTKESNREFIKLMFEQLGNAAFDLIYFETIADNFIHYAWYIRKLYQKNIVMTLHDSKGFFYYSPSLSIRKLIRFSGKRKLIKIVPALNVLTETLFPFLQKELQGKKTIFNIPGAFFEPEGFKPIEYKTGEFIKIAIPGSVDTRRRNYDSVLEFLEKIKSAGLKVSITLLGSFRKGYSELIYSKCIQQVQSNSRLHIYKEDTVSQQEFDKIMKEAHFIWMPLNKFAVVTDGVKEEYGKTISTGNTGDVIRHVKPFFAPSYFTIDPALKKSCCQYSDINEIIGKLKTIDSAEYKRLQEDALNASLNYTKDKIVERNKDLFA
jgi:hypothetical protein